MPYQTTFAFPKNYYHSVLFFVCISSTDSCLYSSEQSCNMWDAKSLINCTIDLKLSVRVLFSFATCHLFGLLIKDLRVLTPPLNKENSLIHSFLTPAKLCKVLLVKTRC